MKDSMQRQEHIHLIGIGGSGMSPIAHILLDMGCVVSGSDLNSSNITSKLQERGAEIFKKHSATNISNPDLVVVSAAIPEENEELKEARRRGIRVMQRIEMLGQLMSMKKGIAIAGTHGKTTTTSMVSLIVERCGGDPTILIGGELNDIGGSAKLGKGPYLIAEADESNGQFLHLSPTIAVITNIDNDHLDYYGTIDDVISAFLAFLEKVPPDGVAIVCIDDKNIRNIVSRIDSRIVSYGLSEDADIYATNIRIEGFGSSFEIVCHGKECTRVTLNVPGEHNIRNALAALVVAREIGIPLEKAAGVLSEFRGVHRRFEIVGRINGFTVVDDYAHHPTELQATLAAARSGWKNGRVIAVFQPHRYSRTKSLIKEFAEVLSEADIVFVTDIYSAGEELIPGVSSSNLCKLLNDEGKCMSYYVPSLEELAQRLAFMVRESDLVLTLGAGNIHTIGKDLLSRFAVADSLEQDESEESLLVEKVPDIA